MKHSRSMKPAFIFFLILLAAACFFGLYYGSYQMNFQRIINTILGHGTPSEHLAVWGIRIPRILVAIFVGIALSCAGCTIQTASRNPLAEPGIIGINAGATLGVVLLINAQSTAYYSAIKTGTLLLIPVVSLTGALISSGLIYLLSCKKGVLGTNRLLLVGIGFNIGINSIITLFQLAMNKSNFQQVLNWTNGSLWGTGFSYLFLIAPVTILVLIILLIKSKTLDLLALGDDLALHLGVSVEKERKQLILLAVILSSVSVAVAGNIAFVGLLGPHIAHQVAGAAHRKKLILGGLISGTLVVFSDTLSRNLFSPIEIPLGIVLSLIGVPYFIFLLLKQRSSL